MKPERPRRPGARRPRPTGNRPPPGAAPQPAPATTSSRAAAQRVLREWEQGQRHAAELIEHVNPGSNRSGPDRALLLDLVFTVLRHLSLLDHWITLLTGGRDLDAPTRWLLRAGMAELLLLNHAPHAAVNETVALSPRAGGLVNAVLRRACREKDALLADRATLPLPTRHSHPAFLLDRWEEQFGTAGAEALALWNQQPAPVFLRLNRLRPEAEACLATLTGLEPVGGDFYRCRQLPLEALRQGHVYAQDPSTALAPGLADARPGQTVLDACAAPGGKTALLAQAMQNQGRLIGCDLPGHRLERLRDNLARLGVTCAEVRGIDWLAPAPLPPWLPADGCDVILLDAPCSNTGVMRRRVDVRWRLTEAEFSRLIALQRQLLERLLPYLKPGGRLIYSTCSIDAEENEQQIAALLTDHPELRLATSSHRLPHLDATDGAYAAVLVSAS